MISSEEREGKGRRKDVERYDGSDAMPFVCLFVSQPAIEAVEGI